MRAAVLAARRHAAAHRPSARRTVGVQQSSLFERSFAVVGLAVLLFMNVAMPSWTIGAYPVRGMLAAGMLVLLATWYGERLLVVLQRHMTIVLLAIGLAALGTFVTLINGAGMDAIVEGVMEVHLQVVVTLLLAGVVAEICGPRTCILTLVGVVGLSAAAAFLQMMNVEAAWQMRVALGEFQGQVRELKALIRLRPLGLSYSPIQLTTQACLAFAAYAAWRDAVRRRKGLSGTADPAIIPLLIAFAAVCIASGTRSPILGAVAFFFIYSATRRGSWVPMMLVGAATAGYFAWPAIMSMLETAQPRIVDESTAWNRLTLTYYGLLLFIDNPLGYGFAFKPFDHWTEYWRELYHLPAPTAVQTAELHNYFINMLNTYGIGLLLFVPVVVRLLVQARTSLIFFIPYILHISFHNAGPFWNDNIFWFAVAALSATAGAEPVMNRVRKRRLTGARALSPRMRAPGEQPAAGTAPPAPNSDRAEPSVVQPAPLPIASPTLPKTRFGT